jgi:hypothetical protein
MFWSIRRAEAAGPVTRLYALVLSSHADGRSIKPKLNVQDTALRTAMFVISSSLLLICLFSEEQSLTATLHTPQSPSEEMSKCPLSCIRKILRLKMYSSFLSHFPYFEKN